jgi:hypothetical protein
MFNLENSALTVSVHGGYNGGVLAIFNDATLSPKFGGQIQYHALSGARRSIQFDVETCAALDLAVRKADVAYAVRMAEIAANGDTIQRRIDRAAYTAKQHKQADSLRVLDSLPTLTAAQALTRDSLRLEKARTDATLSWLDWVRVPRRGAAEQAAGNARAKAYQAARASLDVVGSSFGWWSLSGAIDNSSFNLFDPQAQQAAQISKRTFVAKSFGITYSRIRQSPFADDSWYVAVNAKFGWEDNLSSLTKLNIVDRQQYSPPPTERVAETQTTAYQGGYRDDIATVRLAGDWYRFILPQNRLAVHVFPAFSAKDGEAGQVALGAGILFTAPAADKKTSNANAELFFNAPDLANTRHSKDNPWKRGSLGLILTFPIHFAPGT